MNGKHSFRKLETRAGVGRGGDPLLVCLCAKEDLQVEGTEIANVWGDMGQFALWLP